MGQITSALWTTLLSFGVSTIILGGILHFNNTLLDKKCSLFTVGAVIIAIALVIFLSGNVFNVILWGAFVGFTTGLILVLHIYKVVNLHEEIQKIRTPLLQNQIV